MITPRRTRLVRVPDLAGVRAHLVGLVRDLDPLTAADTFVIVPTSAAGEQLRRTLEDRLLTAPDRTMALPLIGTRADVYAALVDRLDAPRRALTMFEREVLLAAAARDVEESGVTPPFHLRPALVGEMLALYDQVRRQHRTVPDFERLLVAELEPAADADRGAYQLLEQTRFLVAAFTAYERRLSDGERVDEHGIRDAVLGGGLGHPLHHVVVTVGDHLSEPDGLWPADMALLTAMAGLDAIDVVATAGLLASGLVERLRLAFVGIHEVDVGSPGTSPVLVVPPPDADGEPAHAFAYRDREDELEGVARRVKADRRAAGRRRLDRMALVVPRPLPYLYLAREVFGGAGLPFEALDTLPLAAEPYAAALDLVLTFVAEDFSKSAATALLRSPHFCFVVDGQESTALRTLLEASAALSPLRETAPLVDQLARLVTFLNAHNHDGAGPADVANRRQRVKAAVIGALEDLAEAYRRHDPGASGTVTELAPAIRRWLGSQTFAARTGASGLQIVDPQAARFGEFDDVQLMGLVDGEWPEPPRRNIFYPQALLTLLEPTKPERVEVHHERDRLRATRAAFRDLMGLARMRTRVSTFSLEADSVVEPSVLIEDIAVAGLATERAAPAAELRVFAYEALGLAPMVVGPLPAATAAWARLRAAGTDRESPRLHGEAGPWVLPRVSVSRLDRYLKCPFQFYASEVLGLDEEPEDEDTRSPLERGRFLHEIFETFFREWPRRGHGRITAATLDEAGALFAELCEPLLERLPSTDAALERARLFGSAVGPGMADRVFVMEAERTQGIRQRLLEFPIEGEFTFAAGDGSTRVVLLRATVDRVDLLDDGTFRLIDYKMRWVPDIKQALQLPIYSACVRARLSADLGVDVSPSEVMYLSLEGDKSITTLKGKDQTIEELVIAAEHRLVGALDNIAAGHFPPRPSEQSLCRTCPYVSVCREPGGTRDPGVGIQESGDA